MNDGLALCRVDYVRDLDQSRFLPASAVVTVLALTPSVFKEKKARSDGLVGFRRPCDLDWPYPRIWNTIRTYKEKYWQHHCRIPASLLISFVLSSASTTSYCGLGFRPLLSCIWNPLTCRGRFVRSRVWPHLKNSMIMESWTTLFVKLVSPHRLMLPLCPKKLWKTDKSGMVADPFQHLTLSTSRILCPKTFSICSAKVVHPQTVDMIPSLSYRCILHMLLSALPFHTGQFFKLIANSCNPAQESLLNLRLNLIEPFNVLNWIRHLDTFCRDKFFGHFVKD